MHLRSRRAVLGAASMLLLGLRITARAQPAWPVRPIRLIVPGGAGSSADTAARFLALALEPRLGAAVIVDNRAGALGAIGSAAVAMAPPDGYTLLLGALDTQVLLPLVNRRLAYSPENDFVPVARVAQSSLVVAAHPRLGAASLQEMIALARARPGRLTYGSAGVGGSQQLVFEMLKQREKLYMLHVPYRSATAAAQGLLAGEVDLLAASPTFFAPHIASGQLRGIAIARETRHPLLPTVPTFAESGLGNFTAAIWLGVFAPAATPADVVTRISAAVVDALGSADLRGKLQAGGQDVLPLAQGDFARFVAAERGRWRDVVETAGVRME